MSTEFKVGQKVKGTTSFEGEITYVYASGDLPLLEVRTAEKHHLVVRKADARVDIQSESLPLGTVARIEQSYSSLDRVLTKLDGHGRVWRRLDGYSGDFIQESSGGFEVRTIHFQPAAPLATTEPPF